MTLEERILELKARIRELEKGVQADQILRSIAINSPSNIMLLDREARIRYINHTVPGITPEEMLGLYLPDIVEERFRPGILGALERVARTAEPDRYETSYISPSGDVSWWDSRVGPVLQGSLVTAYVVVSTNITEQHRRLEEQERFFNLSVDMMCVAGFDGYFKRVNQAFKTTLGYDKELAQLPFLSFVHPEDVQATMDSVAHVFAGGNPGDFRNRYRAADGSYRLLSWRGAADPKREVIYAVARDITDTMNLDERLQQSRRMEAIGQLAGGIAHDFNNLLTAIQGNIELAQVSSELAPTCLPAALIATGRAAALTRQLLIFSRHQALTPTVVQLRPLLDNVISMLKRLLPETIRVTLESADDAPAVLADKSQLEQVIVNLCLNARDAMPEGGQLKLAIGKKHAGEDKREYLCLSVTDSGCGMSQEVQSHIFEPFFTTKEVGKGTGLGLATVYGIVQKHGGFLELESALGKGTTFHVYLPATTEVPHSPSVFSAPPTVTQGGKETILVAEDEPMVLNVVTEMLSKAGYTVLTATNGLEAVQLLDQDPARVALALMDVVMPNLGGLDTAVRLRAIRPDLKMIFASGHVQNLQDVERLQSETFLPKPYQRDELLNSIRHALDS
jgi:PAS domain S-box-containing protein